MEGAAAVSRAGRQIVSPANDLGVGPRRASVGAGLEFCNGNDRRRWRKQGVAVGAAASKTQAIAKRMLGAATRRCSWRKLSAGPPYSQHTAPGWGFSAVGGTMASAFFFAWVRLGALAFFGSWGLSRAAFSTWVRLCMGRKVRFFFTSSSTS